MLKEAEEARLMSGLLTEAGGWEGVSCQVCWDPRSAAHNNFHVAYNHPLCRHKARNQGSCGSCYAFAMLGVFDYQRCMTSKDQWWKPLSAMYADSCLAPKASQGVCNGGAYQSMTDGYARWGLPLEECWPYAYAGDPLGHFGADVTSVDCAALTSTYTSEQGKNSECAAGGASDVFYQKDYEKITSRGYEATYVGWASYPWYGHYRYESLSLSAANADKIKGKIQEQGSLWMAFDVYGEFTEASNKYYKTPYTENQPGSYKSGGHAVQIVGYGEWTSGGVTKKFWVVENSWDDTWADRGFAYWDADLDWSGIGAEVAYWINWDATTYKHSGKPNLDSDETAFSGGTSVRRMLSEKQAKKNGMGDEVGFKTFFPRWEDKYAGQLAAINARRRLLSAPPPAESSSGETPPFDPAQADSGSMSRAQGKLEMSDCELGELQSTLDMYIEELMTYLNSEEGKDMLQGVTVYDIKVELPFTCQNQVQLDANVSAGSKFDVKVEIEYSLSALTGREKIEKSYSLSGTTVAAIADLAPDSGSEESVDSVLTQAKSIEGFSAVEIEARSTLAEHTYAEATAFSPPPAATTTDETDSSTAVSLRMNAVFVAFLVAFAAVFA
ncbi:hypothetical protein CYMTET_31685 [Cymbomonas tetramitiformis]|uniref:Peptidase C1A papain C-terminal domain-containing protein n=1 Tax=Cymbomonas tetramitiformis TaxID=36881 RepID=A0AAE0KSX8_9CHLO|nr:hypothetical protein CYMTET_31685 [Cymbomonas tetramitiformis]